MSNNRVQLILWVVLPIINFFYWFLVGRNKAIEDGCRESMDAYIDQLREQEASVCNDEYKYKSSLMKSSNVVGKYNTKACSPALKAEDFQSQHLDFILTGELDKFRVERLAPMNLDNGVLRFYTGTSYSMIIKNRDDEICSSYNHQFTNQKPFACFAVAKLSNISSPLNVVRFDTDVDETGNSIANPEKDYVESIKKDPDLRFQGNQYNKGLVRSCGFFRKVPKLKGRERIYMKLGPFIRNFDGPNGIETQLNNKLRSNSIKVGDDLVVMVVNQGEIDLFLNFACSCQQNGISLKNVIVFAGDRESVTVIESTGAMGLYHKGYAAVSKSASADYLDRVFVDMMWYKAFSIYLILRKGINVLFQDVDLVWFREPFSYFKNYIKSTEVETQRTGSTIDGFFSDDGQRSKRYAPFYANSGFYYLISSPRSIRFAWAIMISFDAVQVLGSHQNVFTMKLVEGLGIGSANVKLLPLDDFATGLQFHHDKKYMERLRNGTEHPYNFHMCWTQGKPDKLIYLRKAHMWYLTKKCSDVETLIPGGAIYDTMGDLERDKEMNPGVRWGKVAADCCTSMPHAPKK